VSRFGFVLFVLISIVFALNLNSELIGEHAVDCIKTFQQQLFISDI